MKKFLSILSFLTLSVFTFCACSEDDPDDLPKVKINLTSPAEYAIYGQGEINLNFTIEPSDYDISNRLEIAIDSFRSSSASISTMSNLNPVNLSKPTRGEKAGEWTARLTFNGLENVSGFAVGHLTVKEKGLSLGESKSFRINLKTVNYRTANRVVVNLNDQSDWNKEFSIDLSDAWTYYGDNLTLDTRDIHLYDKDNNKWVESAERPSFAGQLQITGKTASTQIIIDESDNIPKGEYHWLIKGKVAEQEVNIILPLIVGRK